MTVRPATARETSTWRDDAVLSLRRLAAASWAGALLGLLVGGVGGRLFMGFLAGLNREDHGVITSDGFPMGEITVSGTLNLFLVGTMLGVLGAAIYLSLRGLTVGPLWFRRLCTVVGGTVMVGAAMVHEDGPDFTLLEPTWAAIALTLAVPCVFLLLMPPAVDAVTRDGGWLPQRRWVWLALVPFVFPLFFMIPLLVVGWWLTRLARQRPDAGRVGAWAARGILVALFVGGALNLGQEVAAIYDTVGEGRYLLD